MRKLAKPLLGVVLACFLSISAHAAAPETLRHIQGLTTTQLPETLSRGGDYSV